MTPVREAELRELCRPEQILQVSGRLVEMDEGVSVSGDTVANPVALLEKSTLPDDFSALLGNLGVLFLLVRKNLGSFEEEMDSPCRTKRQFKLLSIPYGKQRLAHLHKLTSRTRI